MADESKDAEVERLKKELEVLTAKREVAEEKADLRESKDSEKDRIKKARRPTGAWKVLLFIYKRIAKLRANPERMQAFIDQTFSPPKKKGDK